MSRCLILILFMLLCRCCGMVSFFILILMVSLVLSLIRIWCLVMVI